VHAAQNNGTAWAHGQRGAHAQARVDQARRLERSQSRHPQIRAGIHAATRMGIRRRDRAATLSPTDATACAEVEE